MLVRLLAALLFSLPLAAAVPTPRSHFGHEIGADRTVLDWDRVVSYFRALLENTIFLLTPSLNPDGVDIVTRWYRKTLGTPFEGTMPPELYQKYTGHDNNRDWYMLSQQETRLVIGKLHNVWHPQIVYDV